MEFIHRVADIVIHLDRYLNQIIGQFGVWTYFVLSFVIFMETGFVVTPFLPGDSLLFAAGALAALGTLDPLVLIIILPLAAVSGDTLNYWLGRYLGPKVFSRERSRLFRRDHLEKTHDFYERHGRKTIIIARYVPIVRTFAPFVAGVGKMPYARFITFSLIGGVSWVCLFVLGGYFFGNIPFIKRNFTLVVLAIIALSVLPAALEARRQRRAARKPGA